MTAQRFALFPTIGFTEAAERAASLILGRGLAEKWVEGAIYPCEMAFFLAACDVQGIEVIIESGRQDGYSTEILGRWAQARQVEVISIDLEEDRECAERCRKRLSSLSLTLIKGNAYVEVGRTVRNLAGRRTALLLDGPKGWAALSLISAAVEKHVVVVALHNLADGLPERGWFEARGGCFYEDVIEAGGPSWTELRRREIDRAIHSNAARSTTISSLGLIVLDDRLRHQLARSCEPVFGLHQPWLVRFCWQLGAFGLTPKLYGLSNRLLDR